MQQRQEHQADVDEAARHDHEEVFLHLRPHATETAGASLAYGLIRSDEWEQELALRHVPQPMSDPLEVEQPGLRAYRAPEASGAEPSGLREYALLLWRKRVTILVVAAICVGATLAYCILTKPTYEASASVLLETPFRRRSSRPAPPPASHRCPTCPTALR